MKGLIGYTGFIGSNLLEQTSFDKLFNSKNIQEIENKEYEILVCAGVRAVKWFANENPDIDKKEIEKLKSSLKKVKVKKFILISTIDVYAFNNYGNEKEHSDINKLDFYGKNRVSLENWVKINFEDYLIIRLPALFGKNLKKNFIFDLLTLIPSMLKEDKFFEIIKKVKLEDKKLLMRAYSKDCFNSYNFNWQEENEIKEKAKEIFKNLNFTSLNFTDSRNEYQFYNLKNLWQDIEKAIKEDIHILNIATEPISCKEVVKYCFNKEFDNILINKHPLKYNVKSIYANFYNKQDYLYSKEEILKDLKEFLIKDGKNE